MFPSFSRLACLLLILCLAAFALQAVVPYTGEAYKNPYEGEVFRSRAMLFFAPEQPDFLFTKGDSVTIYCQPVDCTIHLVWGLYRDLLKTPCLTGQALPDANSTYAITIPTKGLPGGFYNIYVRVFKSDTQYQDATSTFGWMVDKQAVPMQVPADFSTFWQNAVQEITAVPLDMKITREKVMSNAEIDQYNLAYSYLPEHIDPAGEKYKQIEVYKVNFAALNGKRVYGWFTKPVGPGPFPAILILPGAGNRWRPIPAEQARHGYATLDVHLYN